MPKVSIIVPVYNAAKYLSECLDSLINQTIKEIEILCINDGSKDNSLDILNEYAKKDERILVFSQENSGPAAARNVGLANASGEYLMFCDADDSYEPDMCNQMYKAIDSFDCDFVMCNTIGLNKTGEQQKNSYYFANNAGLYNLDSNICFKTNVYLWNKIFKKNIIDEYKIEFPNGHKADDNYFVFAYLCCSKTGYFLDKNLYRHYDREGSIMDLYKSNKIVFQDVKDKIDILRLLYDFLDKNKIWKYSSGFYKKILYNEIFYAWINVPDIWTNDFLRQCQELLNKLCINNYCENPNINTLFEQIKTGAFEAAIRHLDSLLSEQNKQRRRYDLQNEISPYFKHNNIGLVFNCDSNYVKYLSVTLQSIIDKSRETNNYDIVILNENISQENKDILSEQIKNYNNFSIRYYDLKYFIKENNANEWFTCNHINTSAYYRLFIAEIFKNYKTVVYLDSDLIINCDIAEILNENSNKYSVCAVRDYYISKIKENYELRRSFKGLYSYLKNTLKIREINKYFNSGVVIFNIDLINKKGYFTEFMKIAKINNAYFHDQNVLNSVLNEDVEIIADKWNVQLNNNDPPSMHANIATPYDAKIIHYCSKKKPWNQYNGLWNHIWWQYARKTPFYEKLIFDATDKKNKSIPAANNNIIDNKKTKYNKMEKILSFKNSKDGRHKIITILGIKAKIKKRRR